MRAARLGNHVLNVRVAESLKSQRSKGFLSSKCTTAPQYMYEIENPSKSTSENVYIFVLV
jgi:hypothetical protein